MDAGISGSKVLNRGYSQRRGRAEWLLERQGTTDGRADEAIEQIAAMHESGSGR